MGIHRGKHHILVLGGTSEARALAKRLAGRVDVAATLSLAGRTVAPAGQALPVVSGGFGGAEGLARYLAEKAIDLLVDATHPYAARISAHAAEATRLAGVEIVALRRPGWVAGPGDHWTVVGSWADALAVLGDAPRRVFAALGRKEIRFTEGAPQHFWLVRSVDPIEPPLAVPHAAYVLARGPFDPAGECALLTQHRIDAILCKNSGGEATRAKLDAARELGIEVIMLARPALPDVASAAGVEDLMALIDHRLASAAKRGV